MSGISEERSIIMISTIHVQSETASLPSSLFSSLTFIANLFSSIGESTSLSNSIKHLTSSRLTSVN